MMEMQKKKSGPTTDKHDRRRGRPAGKNRTPLSLQERRARNAQYERERRNETADAMAHLAKAVRCDPQIANADLLATVISQLQRRSKRKLPQDIDDMRRVNQNLEEQISALQSRLGQDVDFNISSEELNVSDAGDRSETVEFNFQTKETTTNIRLKSKCPTRQTTKMRESDIQTTEGEVMSSRKNRKTSKSSSVRERLPDCDTGTQSESDSNSDWCESVKTYSTRYHLRKRNKKVSEQSECSTSTYPYRTVSESSQCGTLRSLKPHSDDSNLSDASEHPINVGNENYVDLSAIPEQNEEYMVLFDDHTEASLLGTLTEGGNRIINEWLNQNDGGSKTLRVPKHVDNQVLQFLDFDNFLLGIDNIKYEDTYR